MYLTLAIFSSILAVAIIASVLITIWSISRLNKQNNRMGHYMMKWTLLDYAVLLLIICGMLFLLADVIGVVHDRAQYPYWHYGYLLCGFIFTLLGMLFIVVRLSIVLNMVRPDHFPSVNDHHKPDQTDSAKNGIQNG